MLEEINESDISYCLYSLNIIVYCVATHVTLKVIKLLQSFKVTMFYLYFNIKSITIIHEYKILSHYEKIVWFV